jgi:hypothetical protein
MGTKAYDNALDLITFSRASGGTALRKISYGSELVTNGTFDTDSDWTKQTGWAISGGQASHVAGSATLLYQPISLTLGKVYKAACDVVSISGGTGSLQFRSGGTTTGVTLDSGQVGTTVEVLYVADGNTQIAVFAGSGTNISIDNISVKEVLFDQPDGTLTLFNHPNNIPRIDYAADGTVKGLLIEEARTNLVTYSEDFTNAFWTKGGTTSVTSSAKISPDGLSNGTQLDFPNSGDTIYMITTLAVAAHTASVWIKADAAGTIRIARVSSGADGENVSVTTEWQRFDVSITPTTTNDGFQVRRDASGQLSKIYIYGAQLEAGSFPTSYIPTSGATATRAADIASIPVTDFGYNQKSGTVVVEGSVIGLPSIAGYLASITDGTTSKMLVSFVQSSENLRFGVINGSDFTVGLNTATISAGDSLNFAAAYSLNDVAQSLNGAGVQTDTSATIPSPLTIMHIGNRDDSARALNGHIKSIQFYPRRLTNTQLQELTA